MLVKAALVAWWSACTCPTAAANELAQHPEACDRDLLAALHHRIGPTVEAIAEVHFNFTDHRHFEVIEAVSLFQVDQLCRSALRYVESLRLSLSLLICPGLYSLASPGGDAEDCARKTLGQLRLRVHLDEFFADVRYLAAAGSGGESDEATQAWDLAEQEVSEVSQRLEAWVAASCLGYEQRLSAEAYMRIDSLVLRVLRMVSDFLQSLAADLSMLFCAPNYVSYEMLPPPTGVDFGGTSSSLTASIYLDTPNGRSFKPAFTEALKEPISTLVQPSFMPSFGECEAVRPEAAASFVPVEFADRPAVWAHRDVSGVLRRLPSPLQLLHAASHHTRLSNLFISLQVSPYLLTPASSCGSRLVLYDPSHCLIEQGWGGYFFELNPLPPFNLSVVYSGKPLGPGVRLPRTDVHSIHVPSMDTQWSSLVSTFKSMNHHSPDLLFISPFVGNCRIADRLLGTGTIRPKLIYLPVNPLVPPPEEVAPDFFEWWSSRGGDEFLQQLVTGMRVTESLSVTTSVWLAQCSIASAAGALSKHGYVLLHLEHTFAAFMWQPLHNRVVTATAETNVSAHDAWLAGWHCSPHSRFLFDLEPLVGVPALLHGNSADTAAAELRETPTLRYFIERSGGGEGKPRQRGRCVEGSCDCFPPWRGALCDVEQPPRRPQSVRAVVHYITADTERDLVDLQRSLSSLWLRFNWNYDYPVVVFHEGLSSSSRLRIVRASENRVWLVLLPRFKEVPKEWAKMADEVAQDFSVGYRAMTRWRSGPIFLEPALAGFDYAMTLDTDSYFPSDLHSDPFEFLHQRGLVAGFPHLGRESASVVVNFVHYFLLYSKLLGLHPRRTRMLASLIESNFKWYQQCLMLDIEILRLDWFRGGPYQDMFRYMDSTGGFWLHRWGNNPFRTFAVALLVEDADVQEMTLTYAHQDYCSCGPGAPPCEWDSSQRMYRCPGVPASSAAGIGSRDLDEGLLDLQPWRGTARQKSNFVPEDILQFVEEHLPQ